MARKPSKKAIRNDLLDQLDRKGIFGGHYVSLVHDYMALYAIKEELIKDIKKRGVTVRYQNGRDQWGEKKNDSIAELNKTSTQMLKILADLGLKGAKFEAGDTGENEEM